MKYLVTGEIMNTGEMVTPEQFTQIINKGIILDLKAYKDLGIKGDIKFKTNGNSCNTRTGIAIVDADTDSEVNYLLQKFPPWFNVNWNVAPLENF